MAKKQAKTKAVKKKVVKKVVAKKTPAKGTAKKPKATAKPGRQKPAVKTLTAEDLARYATWTPHTIRAQYRIWEAEKEEGTFTVRQKKGTLVERTGYRIWENKSDATLTWNLPASMDDGLEALAKKEWDSSDIAYDEYEGSGSAEGKGSTDYDHQGQELDNVEDFEGDGDTEVVNFGSHYSPLRVKVSWNKQAGRVTFEWREVGGWTVMFPSGEWRVVHSDAEMQAAVETLISGSPKQQKPKKTKQKKVNRRSVLDEIIEELRATTVAERSGRAQDEGPKQQKPKKTKQKKVNRQSKK